MRSPTLRIPSDRGELYAWHADALDALQLGRKETIKELAAEGFEAPPVYEGEPQCGYFKAKVAKRALLVPAKIFMLSVVDEAGELVEPERLKCEIGDRDFDVFEVWARLAMRPISVGEYRHLMALRQWAKESAPDQPQAPALDGRPIDWMTVQLPPVPAAPITQGKTKR